MLSGDVHEPVVNYASAALLTSPFPPHLQAGCLFILHRFASSLGEQQVSTQAVSCHTPQSPSVSSGPVEASHVSESPVSNCSHACTHHPTHPDHVFPPSPLHL